jgi:hypothetical protein
MKNIKDYKSFIKSNSSNLDSYTIKFINSEISESEFINYLDNQYSINESLIDKINDKILDVLFAFVSKAQEIGFKILNKLKTIINWIIEKVKNFKKKYPIIYKILVVTIITIIILIVSTASAHAQKTGTPIPTEKIDMAIGFLEKLRSDESISAFDSGKAITHLIDLRDGKIDLPEIGQRAIDIANSAIASVERIGKEAKATNNESLMKTCIDFMKKGQEILSVTWSKSGSTETLTITKS